MRRGRKRGSRPASSKATGFSDQIEGRNPVMEALRASGRVRQLLLDDHARTDPKLQELLKTAARRGLEPRRVSRKELDELTEGRPHNGVVALADGLPSHSLPRFLDGVLDTVDQPLFLLLDEVQYDQNLGAILRTADAAGVTAVIVPRRRGAALSPVVQRIAMGAAEYVPVIHCAILEAMSLLRKAGFTLVGADEGSPLSHSQIDLRGAVGLVMGGEDKGLTQPVRERCHHLVSIPMVGHVPSLNVSVSTGVLLFERMRQLG